MVYKYNRQKKDLYYDGTGVKPEHFLQRGKRYISGCDPLQEMWNRDKKITGDDFGRKKPTEFIYLLGSRFREDEFHLMMKSCLQYAVINSSPRIGKYINKLVLYI